MWGVAQGGLRGGDTDSVIRDFVNQTQVSFDVVRDDEGSYSSFRRALQDASVSPFPLDVLIDGQGRLVSVRGEYDPQALRREIEAALR